MSLEEEKSESIVKIIQNMQRAGESEEKIVQALKETGVSEEQAKKLISVSQADTMALLQTEIGKIVREQLEGELPSLQTYVDKKLIGAREELESKVKTDLRGDLKAMGDDLKRDIKLLHDVNENSAGRIKTVEEKISDLRYEIKEMRMRRLGTRNEWLAFLLVIGGISFYITAVFLLLTQFQNITMDLLLLIITSAITGTAMFFGASVI